MKSADVYLGVMALNKSSYCTNVSVTVIKNEFLQIILDAYKYGNFWGIPPSLYISLLGYSPVYSLILIFMHFCVTLLNTNNAKRFYIKIII